MPTFNKNAISGMKNIAPGPPRADDEKEERTDGREGFREYAVGAALLNSTQVDLAGEEDSAMTVPYDRLVISPANQMTISEDTVEALAGSILRIGLMAPLSVAPLPDGRYEILSGATRYRAIGLLRERGEWPSENGVDVRVVSVEDIDLPLDDDGKKMYSLLSGNIAREKTDRDRRFEHLEWRRLISELRANGVEIFQGVRIAGEKTRTVEASLSGLGERGVREQENIDRNGSELLSEAILGDAVSQRVANELTKLPKEEQDDFIKDCSHEGIHPTTETLRDWRDKRDEEKQQTHAAEEKPRSGAGRPAAQPSVPYGRTAFGKDMAQLKSFFDRVKPFDMKASEHEKLMKHIEAIEKIVESASGASK